MLYEERIETTVPDARGIGRVVIVPEAKRAQVALRSERDTVRGK